MRIIFLTTDCSLDIKFYREDQLQAHYRHLLANHFFSNLNALLSVLRVPDVGVVLKNRIKKTLYMSNFSVSFIQRTF